MTCSYRFLSEHSASRGCAGSWMYVARAFMGGSTLPWRGRSGPRQRRSLPLRSPRSTAVPMLATGRGCTSYRHGRAFAMWFGDERIKSPLNRRERISAEPESRNGRRRAVRMEQHFITAEAHRLGTRSPSVPRSAG